VEDRRHCGRQSAGADFFPGSISSTPMSLTAFNGKLLFNGFNGVNGTELTEDRACRTER
jgi:hypothetical protein